MRRYETIYILRPTMNEDEINAVLENTNSILATDGGQMISLDKWGLRTLAYEVKKETQGYYIYCDYATNPANVSEMERKFRIDEAVMKYMTVKLTDSIDEEGIAAARNDYEAAIVAAAKAEEEASTQEETVTEDKKAPEAKKATEATDATKATDATEATEATEADTAEGSKETA